MSIRRFEEFLDSGAVKRQSPNRQRAFSIIEETGGKTRFLGVSMKSVPSKEMNPNFIVDSCYDIIIEMVRARMLIDGFNAGNSHEAEFSYMTRLGFSEADVRFMDEVRYYRNGTKYYGTMLDMGYAEKVMAFMKRIYPRLLDMVR